MDYSKFDIEDFVADASFQEFCLGNNDQSANFWMHWLEEHPEKRTIVQNAKALYYTLNGNITDESFRADYKSFKKATDHLNPDLSSPFITEFKTTEKRSNRTFLISLSGIAASLLIVFGVYRFRSRVEKTTTSVTQLLYVSPLGKKKSFKLADGTKVILNGGSTLKVAKNFNIDSRDVQLEGEGYFDVVHNSTKTFTVHTGKINVKDIGTIFNVKAYSTDKTTEASLIKGSIEITVNNLSKSKVLLTPNKKFVLFNKRDLSKTNEVTATKKLFAVSAITNNTISNSIVETDWTQNKLTFFDQPFDEIAPQMERWYGVKINIINPQVKGGRFTGTFDHEDIIQVLNALKLSGNFNYRKEGDAISIY
ncbi:FecR family protein [Mucilaginibacter paludis]|uniref:Anti-FecI sigma factor, FecR n=1 Tax=Mucilaginibacter paludis DSM 18603 TaxID=714943 RepID=H1YGG0_9SPHI|nr:FecR domain-containing protein [Mucilaginibacter paludis]EHQ24512.1 anti-FecI sigma factor, FecR [Mucilaginibacter paludis DSM 18603]